MKRGESLVYWDWMCQNTLEINDLGSDNQLPPSPILLMLLLLVFGRPLTGRGDEAAGSAGDGSPQPEESPHLLSLQSITSCASAAGECLFPLQHKLQLEPPNDNFLSRLQ